MNTNLSYPSTLQLEKQLNYWKQQLVNASLVLELPTDKPRPVAQTREVEKLSFTLPQNLSQELHALSQQEGVTIFCTLLAAFQTLLSRYSRQEDILVGCPVMADEGQLMEAKANALVLRTCMSGNPSFRDLLQKVRLVVLEARANQDVPFDKLVEELQIERSPSYHPLFQVMFVLQNTSRQTLELPELTVTPIEMASLVSKLDLTLSIEVIEQGLRGVWEYNPNLFNPGTIDRLRGHFQTLLESLVTHLDCPISQLPLLNATEKQQLLVEWNNTRKDYPQQFIHELFEEQVKRTPDAVALVFEGEQLTYRALNSRANQLAHYLRSLGVRPDVLVGICMERSLEMVVGLLGILKAGGAYVPLDPEYPQERLAYMLTDSQVSVLLTQEKLVSRLNHQALVICLDTDWEKISGEQTINLNSGVQPDNLVYVIYTSGSTGKPKGAMNVHSGVCNRLLWMQEAYQLTPVDKVLQKTPFSFDVSVWEFFWTLITGACLVIAKPGGHRDANYLVNLIVKEQITTLHFVPSMLQVFLESEGLEQCNSLHKVFCSGEALSLDLQEKFFKCLRCELHNLYGPTEAAIDVTFWQCQRQSQLRTVPIGRPIANTQIYLLDEHLQPVPVGVPGELHIGGVGLARGYFNRPELTNEKFISNPFIQEETARLYKTGDLARYLPNGEIEYIGRIDNQVKIRGFRIELGEIETVVSQHPAVLQTIVIVREDVPGNRRIVAYLVMKPEQVPVTPSQLRGFAEERLPDYMLPSAFVFLETVPLTPNGKVDRRALPAPNASDLLDSSNFVAPRTPTEEILAAIWSQVLGLEPIGIHSNFFELGGHSLLATQVISRLRQTFGVEMPMQRLFETPTIAGLASAIATFQNQSKNEHLPIPRQVNRRSVPLSYVQQQLWFLAQLKPDSAAYNIVEAMQLQGDLKVDVLQKSLDALVVHHEVLRTTFIIENGTPVQVIGEPRSVELKVVDLKDCSLSDRTTVVHKQLQNEAQRPFNLASDLMLRACLFELSPQEHILMLTMHHIATDGWSMSILFEQLTTLYKAYTENWPNPLPKLPIQFADYAVWQRQWLEGDVLNKQLSYWKQHLADATNVLELPADRQRPPVQNFRGATQYFEIPQSLSQALNALSRKESVTLFMTLLAAFQTLLYRYTGQQDILVGSPIAGRNRTEIENLIGFFVNTLVMRTDLSGNPSFQKLLQRVREIAISAYANQDLPFEKLVQELQPERSLSFHPLFQVMFVLQNTPKQMLELPGLSIASIDVDKLTSQLDMTVVVEETKQGLRVIWEYNTDLFDDITVTRMYGHFQTLLAGIVANPHQKIDELPLLTPSEHQLLSEWNKTQVDYPQGCIHELFEDQVQRTPHAVAVMFENEQFTYEKLNNRANQLAHYLKTLGVKPGVLVGICMERSLEVVVGLLGILKAGGAYVPLDPEYPKERLTFLIEDTQIPVILTQKKCIKSLPTHEAQSVCLDSDWEIISRYSQQNLNCEVTADSLLYIIYTSGSTGKPKGVMIPHRGISNMLHWRQETFKLTAQDKVLQTYSLSFDPSVWQIFWPLLFGAQLVMARPQGHKDTAYLVNEIIERQITVIGLVPSIMNALLEEKKLEQCRSLRHITTGGEVLSVELMERFHDRLNLGNLLVNCYGPTEASIDVTAWTNQPYAQNINVPIGRPISNVQAYILDTNLQPVPVGHAGELHIGGIGLATGYLNRPELTEEKFIPNPFSYETGAKLYKTGDLARYLSDGNIEFLGRIDYQVKIRGFRIELGEIEAFLSQHPAVQQTLVMAREDVPGDKRLVAYVVLNADSNALNSNELRSFLKERLPEHMVPSALVILDKMPLYPNGKVNRRALPAPDVSHVSNRNNFVAPRTPTEEVLAEIWSNVLGIEQVGIYDNFFELGGHSLLATQVISRVREAFSIDLSLHRLFEGPNIAELAAIIVQLQLENTEDEEINHLLAELEDLSDEETQNLLAQIMQGS